MTEFNTWFPTSRHGTPALNVMDFGAIADNAAHPLSGVIDPRTGLPYANLAAAQLDYPSAIASDLSDTADWCAITEAFKQAFTTGGVAHGSQSWKNKPVFFPAGQYRTTKPIVWPGSQGAHIYGSGSGTYIYNENTTAPNNICLDTVDLSFCRIENIWFQSAGGTGSIGLNLNGHGNLLINCVFNAPGGVGCNIGATTMGSEMTFIRCEASNCLTGFVIAHGNALNYQFLACTGVYCTLNWIRVNQGGMIVVQNASLAGNGTDPDGYDIYVGGGSCVLIGSRTESKRFVTGVRTTIIGCSQSTPGANDNVFSNAGPVSITSSESLAGRICGPGPLIFDESNVFNQARYPITNIASGAGGAIRVTHGTATDEYFLDGDQVVVQGVVSSGVGDDATNGIWTISKISASQVDLVGSTFVADTYTYTSAQIGPGPRFHLRDIVYPPGANKLNYSLAMAGSSRFVHETKTKNFDLLWIDSGKTFDNLGAAADIIFTLPNVGWPNWNEVRGARYNFVVLEAHNITIRVDPIATGGATSTRIFRAGGYATAGLNVSSAVIGNAIEIVLVDGRASSSEEGLVGHRWLVRSETGTWTIAGTPA